MGTVNGIVVSDRMLPNHASNWVPPGTRSTSLELFLIANSPSDYDAMLPIRVGQGMTDIAKTRDAILHFSFGDEFLFWRIWYEPATIDAGFIVENKEYEIKVWNAYLDVTASITAVSGVATDGTTISHDSLPISIGKFGDEQLILTVLGEGPPLQSTIYTVTVNSVDYTTEIEGIRVVPVPWEPDWDSKVNIEMHFTTALQRNKYFVEQRRPLRYTPYYKFAFRIIAEGLSAQKMKQTMSYGHDKVFGIPVFTEHAYPASDFNSSTTITTSNDLTNLWNLNNQAEYIVIIDHTTLQAEIKEIDTVNANSIECAVAVSDTFTWQRCIVYPVVMCTAEGTSVNPQSDSVFYGDFRMIQYERATGV